MLMHMPFIESCVLPVVNWDFQGFGSSEQILTRVSVGIEECIKRYYSSRVCNALLEELRQFNAEDYP